MGCKMFGLNLFEILVILIVAVIFLGPEKLPKFIADTVKFFKTIKRSIDDAKEAIDKELQISELKQEALEYKAHFEKEAAELTKDIQLQDIHEIFKDYQEEIREGVQEITDLKTQILSVDSSSKPIKKLPADSVKKRGRKKASNTEATAEMTAQQPAKKRGRKPRTEITAQEVATTPTIIDSTKSRGRKPRAKKAAEVTAEIAPANPTAVEIIAVETAQEIAQESTATKLQESTTEVATKDPPTSIATSIVEDPSTTQIITQKLPKDPATKERQNLKNHKKEA